MQKTLIGDGVTASFTLLKLFMPGEMAERLIVMVLKTIVEKSTGGSNPSLSALMIFLALK